MNVIEEVKKFSKKECDAPNACFKDVFENHLLIVVKYALELAEKENADKEIVEIAAWLHDIGSIRGDYKNHHISSAEIAEELLTKLNYPKERIELVKNCILTHRGSVLLKKETKEAQILADADVMSHFENVDKLAKLFGKEYTLKKLERGYNKISPKAREILKDKFEKAKLELK
jgi:uncharacterized protein